MADGAFVTAVGPDGKKRRVPKHYLNNPAFGFKLPPSARAQEPAPTGSPEGAAQATEPAARDTNAVQVEEPAAATHKKTRRPGAAGENKEASS